MSSLLEIVLVYPIPVGICIIVTAVLLKKYINGGVCKYRSDLTGKVVIVTGASAGIGKFSTQELARLGATVVMAVRDIPKAEEAKKAILSSSSNPSKLKIDIMRMDLCELASIHEFAKQFKQKYNRLDILLNNAGVMSIPKRRLTKDGFEMQMGTNHLGHFLLTNLLLDVLKSTKPSRIVNLASLAHTYGTLNLDDLNSEKFYNAHLTYGGTKLANVLFTKELAKRLEGTNVKAVCLHPGVVRTELMRFILEGSAIARIGFVLVSPFYWYFTKSVEQGAQTSLHCALIDHDKLENGKYYSDCRVKKPRELAEDDGMMKKLWDVSAKMVGI